MGTGAGENSSSFDAETCFTILHELFPITTPTISITYYHTHYNTYSIYHRHETGMGPGLEGIR